MRSHVIGGRCCEHCNRVCHKLAPKAFVTYSYISDVYCNERFDEARKEPSSTEPRRPAARLRRTTLHHQSLSYEAAINRSSVWGSPSLIMLGFAGPHTAIDRLAQHPPRWYGLASVVRYTERMCSFVVTPPLISMMWKDDKPPTAKNTTKVIKATIGIVGNFRSTSKVVIAGAGGGPFFISTK